MPEVPHSHESRIGVTEYVSVAQHAGIVRTGRSREEAPHGLADATYFLDIAQLAICFPESKRVQSIYQNALMQMQNEYLQAGLAVPEDILTHLQERIQVVTDKGEAFGPFVEEYVQDFIDYLHNSIGLGGLPLSRDQIKVRLDQVRILYSDSQEMGGVIGSFNPINLSLKISVDDIEDQIMGGTLRRTVFHELWHAISGRRIKRVNNYLSEFGISYFGFSHSKDVFDPYGEKLVKLGASDDEGLIELLAAASAKGYLINFSAEGIEARRQWDELASLVDNEEGCSYREMVKLVCELYKDCSAKAVFGALFKSDFDTAEPDTLAGTHAQRDLWREQKALGGRRRLKQVRAAERALRDFNTNFFSYGNDPIEASVELSKERLVQIERQIGITKARLELLRLKEKGQESPLPEKAA